MNFYEALDLFSEEGAPPSRDNNKKIIRDNNGKVVRHGTGLAVFDIDDNLLKSDSSKIKVYKRVNDGPEIALSTDEFAKDSGKDEKGRPKPGVKYDYREFRDPDKVKSSIVHGKPIMPTLKALDNYIREGYDFCFLTARGLEDVVADSLNEFLMYRDKFGNLQKLGKVFKRDISRAINDAKYNDTLGKLSSDGEKKATVLKELCNKYDNVVFFDDDKNNVIASRALHLPNLKVVHTGRK